MISISKYDDIINLPHHQSDKRPHMPLLDRAAQFAPFAALTGYEDVIDEAGRLTDAFREMDESEKAKLDGILKYLEMRRKEHLWVKVLHFVPDAMKDGGSYLETTGRYLRVDAQKRELILTPYEEGESVFGATEEKQLEPRKFGIEIEKIAKIWIRKGTDWKGELDDVLERE